MSFYALEIEEITDSPISCPKCGGYDVEARFFFPHETSSDLNCHCDECGHKFIITGGVRLSG